MKLDIFKAQREREKHITRLHLILFGIVVTAVVVTLIVINVDRNNKIKRFKKLESDLFTATKYYYSEKESKLEKGTMEIVTMKTIIKKGYLQDEVTSKCNGYTMVTNYRNLEKEYEIEYKSYIKCGDSYKTYGFEEEYIK